MTKCNNIHIICTDPRIQKIYHEYLEKNNLWGDFDTIQYENPLLDFLNSEKLPGMIGRIKAYRQLHSPSKIVIFDHFDCGAYKLNGYKFSKQEEERRIHRENNEKIREILRENFPDMEIKIRYIDIDIEGKCSFFEFD